MGRSWSIRTVILALLLTCLAGCGTGSSTTPAGPSTTPAPAAGALRVNEGDEVTYHTIVKTAFNGRSLSGKTLPVDTPLTGTTALEYDAKLRFDKVVENEATVSYSLSGFKVRTEIGGAELPTATPSAADMHYTMKIDPNTGKLLDVDLGSEFVGVLTKEQLMKTLDQTFAHIPSGTKFAPGNSWTMEIPLPVDLSGIQGESKVTVTTTYEADELRDGVKVARLVITGSGPITMQGDANGVDFSLKGTIEMSGVQYLDLKTGLQHSGESRSTFKFTQSMKEAQSGLTIDTEMEATSEISMVRK